MWSICEANMSSWSQEYEGENEISDIIHIREIFLQNIENEEAILAAAGNNNDWILEYEDIIGTKFKRYDILDSSILQMYEVD